MKRPGRLVIVTIVLIASLISAYIYHTEQLTRKQETGEQPLTADEYQKILGIGINVDWLTYPRVNHYYFQWRSKGVLVPEYFKKAGFNNVRIRVNGDVVTNHTLLTQLSMAVNDSLEAGLIPIITYTAPELRENPTSRIAQQHFIEWLLIIAEKFRNYPYTLSYDLLIKSSGKIKDYPNILNKVYQKTLKEIRLIDPYRIVILTPAKVSSPFYLDELNIPADKYVMAEWHIYAGGPRGCDYNETYIEKSIQAALQWSKSTGIPTWMGAWRPNVYPKAGGGNPTPICPLSIEEEFTRTMITW